MGCALLNAPYSKNALERSVAGGTALPATCITYRAHLRCSVGFYAFALGAGFSEMLSETLPPLIFGALALMCLAFDNTHSRAEAVIASAALSVFATVTVKPPSSVFTTE